MTEVYHQNPDLLQKRVYISNVSYSATESNLHEYLKSYGAISVLVPCQSIRGLKSSFIRPFGIAYADFESHEQALKVIEELNGKEFLERKLVFKLHIPYDATKINISLPKVPRKSLKFTRKGISITNYTDGNVDQKTNKSKHKIQESRKISNNTLFCGYLPGKTTDSDLREFFKKFDPQEIIVFKNRIYKKGIYWHRHYTAALITFSTKENMDNSIETLSNVPLGKKLLKLRPAYLDKINEIRRIVEKDKETETENKNSVDDVLDNLK